MLSESSTTVFAAAANITALRLPWFFFSPFWKSPCTWKLCQPPAFLCTSISSLSCSADYVTEVDVTLALLKYIWLGYAEIQGENRTSVFTCNNISVICHDDFDFGIEG